MAHPYSLLLPALLACLVSASASQAASPLASSGRGRVFASPYLCSQAGGLRPEQCANAFANAQAELDEAAPRFSTRAACEQYFRRCSIDVSARKPAFRPSMQGISVSLSTGRPSVMPVVAATGPGLSFQPRPVDEKRTQRSPQRQKQAQARWDQQLAAPAQLPVDAADPFFTPEKADAYDPNWQKQEGVATYPGPKARARQAPKP